MALFPAITTIQAGASQQFYALIHNATDPETPSSRSGRRGGSQFERSFVNGRRPSFRWSVTAGNVSPTGLFTAPNGGTTTSVVLTASSTVHPSMQASLVIEIMGTPQPPGSPQPTGSPQPPSTPQPPGPPAPPSTSDGQMPVPQLPQVYIDTTFNLPQGTTWRAHTSTDFKNALDSANPGDVIVLDAGKPYVGNFTLPVKSNSSQQWIYIVSSALSSLPLPGVRVDAKSDALNMPKIVTPNGAAAITVPPGASNYRLVGLEIASASTQGCEPPANCFSYQLIYVGGVPGQPLPDSITVDRCYLHGSPTQDVRQGVIANGSRIAVIDSYISDIHQSVFDSQAVLAYFSPGPIKIVNNFLSATTEDVLFGGAGAKKNNPWVPSDIEIRNNWFFKPLEWAAVGVTIPPHNRWVEKNHLEFKSARRVLVDGNTLENTWVSGQTGFAVLFTVRTDQSGNFAVVDDITFTNNVLKNVTSGFSTLYHDETCGKPPYTECTNEGEARRILIYNNLVLFRDPHLPGTPANSNWGLLLDPGMTDFVFENNTTVPAPGTECYQSIFFNVYKNTPWPPPQSITQNVWILNNALCRQPTGGWGGQLTYYMGSPGPLAPRFLGNVMYVPSNDVIKTFPDYNYSSKVPFTYIDPRDGNYQLLTPYWVDTSNKQLSGINSNTLQEALGLHDLN